MVLLQALCGSARALSALLVLASSSKNFVSVYVFITLVSTVLALVLYIVCAAAALKLRVGGKLTFILAIGVLYSIAMFVGSGIERASVEWRGGPLPGSRYALSRVG